MLFLKRWHNFNVLLRSSFNIEWNDSEKHFLKFVLYNWTRIFPNNAIKEIISVIIEIYESAVSNTTKKRWKIDGDYRRFKSEYLNCIYIYIHSIAKCDQICKQTNRLILRGKFGFLNRNKTVWIFFCDNEKLKNPCRITPGATLSQTFKAMTCIMLRKWMSRRHYAYKVCTSV